MPSDEPEYPQDLDVSAFEPTFTTAVPAPAPLFVLYVRIIFEIFEYETGDVPLAPVLPVVT